MVTFNEIPDLTGTSIGKYTIIKRLGQGQFGVTYQAIDDLGGYVAIKFIVNDNGKDWKREAQKAAKLRDVPQIATVFEIDERLIQINGTELTLRYIVWEYVDGTPLGKLLEEKKPLLSPFIVSLTEEICSGIRSMREVNLDHGDLHEYNIILIPPKSWDLDKKYRVKIVDFGLVRSIDSSGLTTDLEYLKRILQKCWEQNQYYAGEILASDKKFQSLLTDLINRMCDPNAERRIQDPIQVISRIHEIQEQANDNLMFKTLTLKHPFEYLSVEEIPENTDLVQYLYTDNVPWLKEILGFGTTIISGPRGSGKSMILKNMRLLTKLKPENLTIDNLRELEYFGVYIHCQHQLYFPFAGVGMKKTSEHYEMFIHYLNLLFTSEILDTMILLENLNLFKFSSTVKNELWQFFNEQVFQENISIFLSDASLLTQCKSIIEKEILLAQRKIIHGSSTAKRTTVGYLQNLIKKLDSVSDFFKNKRFYFLLDDYSNPKVPYDLQRSVNRLIGFRNNRFCFKITTERFGFIQEDSDGKILQQDREFSYIDLGAKYIKAQKLEKKDFMKAILKKRLDKSGLSGISVEQFFGPKTFKGKLTHALLKERQNVNPDKKSKFEYSGFDMIYRLCAGDVSTILELCKEIYFRSESEHEDLKKGISSKLQDRIIRDFSERRLNMIKEIPGVGSSLYQLVETFGNISKKYLYEYSKANRDAPYLEVLRIELTENTDCLCDNSDKLYKKLITEHIFMDGGGSYPWGHGISNVKLILRPIYTPALQISYSDRYSIKIGCELFEKFLSKSLEFERTGTRFLRALSEKQETLDSERFAVVLSSDTEDDLDD